MISLKSATGTLLFPQGMKREGLFYHLNGFSEGPQNTSKVTEGMGVTEFTAPVNPYRTDSPLACARHVDFFQSLVHDVTNTVAG